MYRTLAQLRDSVNSLIEEQGENATCAAFIFTKNDVFYFDEDCEAIYPKDSDAILMALGNVNWIYERINDCISELVKNQQKPEDEDDYEIVVLDT